MGCCDPKAPRLIRLRIGDGEVGISGLDTIAEAVRNLNLEDEKAIKQELLSRVKKLNYIPYSANEKYAEILYDYYLLNINS